MTTPPIVVNADPRRDQLETMGRQALLALAVILAAFGLAKYSGLLTRLADLISPFVTVVTTLAALATAAAGQLHILSLAGKASVMASELPDAQATTRGAPPPAKMLPAIAAAPKAVTPAPPSQILAQVVASPALVRAIPAYVVPYLEKEEGYKTRSYQDSRGRWTIGVGHTGPDVGPGLVWTPAMIFRACTADCETAARRLESAIGAARIQALTDYQYAALLSFVFNVGEVSTWEIWVDLRNGNLADVPTQMARFVYSDGKIIAGLVARRKSDVALWLGQDPAYKLFGPQRAA
jgi:lysozyme